jgi:squalene-hopene/tetraprenyl-beta-curcumene cyclase
MRAVFSVMLFCLPLLTASTQAADFVEAGPDRVPLAPHLTASLEKEALHAIQRGVDFLHSTQQDNGCWSSPQYPAVTSLAASAILNSPAYIDSATRPASVDQALDFILSKMQPDGCIYEPIEGVKGGGMPNYNTSLALMALADVDEERYALMIDQARQCLISGQYLGPGSYHGGMGYDASTGRAYADLSNTMMALEALRRTESPEQKEGQEGLDWDAAIQFISRCQHLKETNDMNWVSDEMDQHGGFVYHPEKSQAGEETTEEGKRLLRSYASMTYAGLLSFIYAEVDRDDPRVQAAYDWIRQNWNLEKNPGMGQEGLYYNYHTMAKALNAFGREEINLPGGKTIAWRPALLEKLVSLQRIDPETGYGFWKNDNNRWWENDPNLVTAYTLLAMEIALYGTSPAMPE